MRPTTEQEVADALVGARGPIVPRGGGTKTGWGLPVDGDALDLRGLDRIIAIEPGDFICVAQAGVRLVDLDAALDGTGMRLMLDPPHGEDATVGGVVAANASGPLRHRYGTPRDLVIGTRFVTSDGTIAKSGGRVVKNVAGYDVSRVLVGSLGMLAVITEVALRLHPVQESTSTVVLETSDPFAAAEFAEAVRSSALMPETLEITWPEGVVAVRYASTRAAARELAKETAGLAPGARIVRRAPPPATRPWDANGPVVAFGVPLAETTSLLRIADAHDAIVSMRAGVGVGEARVADPRGFATAVRSLGGYVTGRRDAVLDVMRTGVEQTIARNIKDRLDPRGILAPGRMWET